MKTMRRVLELYLTTLSEGAGVSFTELLSEAGVERLGIREIFRRGGPHTIATRLTLISERLFSRMPERRTRRLLAAADALVREVTDAIGDGVMLHPPFPTVAPRHGRTIGRPWIINSETIFNLAGTPVTEVPLGLSGGGLPLGVQVVAAPGRDHVAIAVAGELERRLGGWTPPLER
jgi:fatty acid amide hydrolase 2